MQYKILVNAGKYLKRQGELVYSTCTTNIEENYELINRFLNNNKDFVLTDISENIHNKVRALYPNAYIHIFDKEIKILKTHYELKEETSPNKISEITKNSFGIETLDGIIYLDTIKPESKKEMDIKSYINGINKENLLNKYVGDNNGRRK